jgi:hypothetical protein
MYDQKALLKLLGDVFAASGALQVDQLPLQERAKLEAQRYEEGQISLEELGFWYKSLIRAFLAQVDGLCSIMRAAIIQHASTLGINLPRKDDRDLSKAGRMPLERGVVLALRNFPKLFGATYEFDTSGEDFRGFKAMLQARGRFTHPQSRRDVCPPEIFSTTSSSIEWFYGNLRHILMSCVSAIGPQLNDGNSSVRRFRFHDESMNRIEEARSLQDVEMVEDEFIGRLQDITLALWEDTTLALNFVYETFALDSSVNPYCAVRNFIRTLFSEIEGCVFVAAFSLSRFRVGYGEPTEDLLVGSHEEVRGRIFSTLESFSQEFGTGAVIKKTEPEWDSFMMARELRNRFTHPKSPSDLDLRPEELDTVIKVSSWWHTNIDGFFELSGKKLT